MAHVLASSMGCYGPTKVILAQGYLVLMYIAHRHKVPRVGEVGTFEEGARVIRLIADITENREEHNSCLTGTCRSDVHLSDPIWSAMF